MHTSPSPELAARVPDLLLAREIKTAVAGGASVAATGHGDTEAVLELAAQELAEDHVRVLQLRPPFDSDSFLQQFAGAWCQSNRSQGPDQSVGAVTVPMTLPNAAVAPFAVLIQDAHLIPDETLRHLDRMVRIWPPMRLVLGGDPGLINILKSDSLPAVHSKLSVFVTVPLRRPVPVPPAAEPARRPSLAQLAIAEGEDTAIVPRQARRMIVPVEAAPARDNPREARRGTMTVGAGVVAVAAVAWLVVVPGAVPRLRAFVAGPGDDRPTIAFNMEHGSDDAVADLGAPNNAPEHPPAPAETEQATPASEPALSNSTPPVAAPVVTAPVVTASIETAPVETAPIGTAEIGRAPTDTAASDIVPLQEPVANVGSTAPVIDPPATDRTTADEAPLPDAATSAPTETHAAADAPAPMGVEQTGAAAQENVAPAGELKSAELLPTAPPASEPTSEPPAAAAKVVPIAPTIAEPAVAETNEGVVEPVAPTAPPPAPRLSFAMADAMVRRGQIMLQQGNVSAARLLFGRAAEAGYGPAARAMGTTYDAVSLQQIGVVGIRPDPKEAAEWYERAMALGDATARGLLEALRTTSGSSTVQAKVAPR